MKHMTNQKDKKNESSDDEAKIMNFSEDEKELKKTSTTFQFSQEQSN